MWILCSYVRYTCTHTFMFSHVASHLVFFSVHLAFFLASLWHIFWHSTRHSIWHAIWDLLWHSVWLLCDNHSIHSPSHSDFFFWHEFRVRACADWLTLAVGFGSIPFVPRHLLWAWSLGVGQEEGRRRARKRGKGERKKWERTKERSCTLVRI